ncbi:hypothetical protein [Enterovibrio norvegicus]|uniref:Lipoprotein n=2 Tax=Enterovibrio norvegicus TaxID=188144 RepID=A0A1I5VCC7_9GAMM|nr:hypothetical protein [Enterovibrio norvegicus]SFQ05159.1 hypothetical protein SAMN03084138_03897 [Enterovibrio norvegicus DSM 15893]
MGVYRLILVGFVLVVVGCASTSESDSIDQCSNKTLGSLSKELKMMGKPESDEMAAHTVSQYVYRAAKVAAQDGYDKFALINIPLCDKPANIGVFMHDNQQELQGFMRRFGGTKGLELLGVFNTMDYQGKRYLDVRSVPGAA